MRLVVLLMGLAVSSAALSCSQEALRTLLALGQPQEELDGLVELLLQHNAAHSERLRAGRVVLVSTLTGSLGKQDAQLGVYMKSLVSGFVLALLTRRALLVQDEGPLSLTKLLAPVTEPNSITDY